MSIEYKCEPYKSVGKYIFGMLRNDIKNISGEPLSTQNYGYPISDKFLDDYGYFYILSSNKNVFEAIEFYPEYSSDTIVLVYDKQRIELDVNIQKTVENLRKITDDLIADEDGYKSDNLGLQLFCPDNYLENVIIYARHYYD